MRESLRPITERYQIKWAKRQGFIKLAIETGSPIILAACPAADDLYDVYPSHVTAWAYRTLKIPLFFAKGLGLTPIPKPIRLTHYLSEPMIPPAKSPNVEEFNQQVSEFHAKVCQRMETLIKLALKQEKRHK
jgi:hypothetical protein